MRVLKLYRDYLVYVCSEKFFPDGNEKHSLYPRINFSLVKRLFRSHSPYI